MGFLKLGVELVQVKIVKVQHLLLKRRINNLSALAASTIGNVSRFEFVFGLCLV